MFVNFLIFFQKRKYAAYRGFNPRFGNEVGRFAQWEAIPFGVVFLKKKYFGKVSTKTFILSFQIETLEKLSLY